MTNKEEKEAREEKRAEKDQDIACVMHANREEMMKHFHDFSNMVSLQKESLEQTRALTGIQDRLTSSVDSLSKNLEGGIKMGNGVVRLFGKIVYVFLAVVVVLALVIIWIARLEVEKGDLKVGRHEKKTESRSD